MSSSRNMAAALALQGVPGSMKWVAFAIGQCSLVDDDVAYLNTWHLTSLTGCNASTVRMALDQLEARGVIWRMPGGRHPHAGDSVEWRIGFVGIAEEPVQMEAL